MVPPIILSLLETPRQPHPPSAALPFERNLVIPKRRLPRQTSNGPLQRPIWNTFLDPDQLPTVRIPYDGMRRGGATTSKELRERVESIKWHSETFLSHEFIAHSAFRPDYVKTAHPRFVSPQYRPFSRLGVYLGPARNFINLIEY